MSDLEVYGSYQIVDRKVILRIRDRVCETTDELLASELFRDILQRFIRDIKRKKSPLLALFHDAEVKEINAQDIDELVDTLQLLAKLPCAAVEKLAASSPRFIGQPYLLYEFVERLYDYWREFERIIVCDSEGDRLDKRPYRTFNRTIETLTHVVRSAYRDVQENISGKHPTIYRQVIAGAAMAAIALPRQVIGPVSDGIPAPFPYSQLDGVPVIRQICIVPPMLINPPMNKRTGQFVQVEQNPLALTQINPAEWLCYPAKVGQRLILIYFHQKFFELGFSLCNLFEMAEDEFLTQRADALLLYGVPGQSLDGWAAHPTVFYDDLDTGILVGAIPGRDEFAYFGYLKKMTLTLHNIAAMKQGQLPYHGACVRFSMQNGREATILIAGDTGTGKSETLEAFRALGETQLREMVIIADDMGSLALDVDGRLLSYGTETGAFVRLDDLHPGYAFGHLDRTIIMNPGQVNARVILPVTSYENVVRGYPVDMVLYANNYEQVSDTHPVIERFPRAESALEVFRRGISMSKGTTTDTGLVETYFTNVFGPLQFREMHEKLAARYFNAFFINGIYVGQLRTRLGLPGWERRGPEQAAQKLLEMLNGNQLLTAQH